MPSNNQCIIAAAGSGKTKQVVNLALEFASASSKRVLITTYTNQNIDQINRYLREEGVRPPNITVLSWFRFVLREGIRPYQASVTSLNRVESVSVGKLPRIRYISQKEADRYYFNSSRPPNIHSEFLSDFAVYANEKSEGKVISRLEQIYHTILVDEVQDLGGWDLELLDLLMRSSIRVILVGDPRQSILNTNRNLKNKQYRGENIARWFKRQEKKGLCQVTEMNICRRSNQEICDFSDRLFPDLPRTTSVSNEQTGHDGFFCIKRGDVPEYIRRYSPVVLRHNVLMNVMGLNAMNIGVAKGLTFDRVLIFPTTTMKKYLMSGDLADLKDPKRLYVAVTRARHSVAFVI